MRKLKAELHSHTLGDPHDPIQYTPECLIDLAASKGYDVLAITCHDRMLWSEALANYAGRQGILLIPGVEATVQGRHVLLYNQEFDPQRFDTFDGLRRNKSPRALAMAAHPYFPAPHALLGQLRRHIDLFDAIEYCHFYTGWINFNRQAVRVAKEHGLPLVGTSDVHHLWQLGKTWSLIEAEKNVDSVLDAIRRGAVEVVTRPLAWSDVAGFGLGRLLPNPVAVFRSFFG